MDAPLPANAGVNTSAIEDYLLQLLPGLAKSNLITGSGKSSTGGSLAALGLDRGALLASGLQHHAINALHRALSAHAGASSRC